MACRATRIAIRRFMRPLYFETPLDTAQTKVCAGTFLHLFLHRLKSVPPVVRDLSAHGGTDSSLYRIFMAESGSPLHARCGSAAAHPRGSRASGVAALYVHPQCECAETNRIPKR